MTDEQLQSLFAGMERHLDKRADEIQQRVTEQVTGLRAEIKAMGEHVETSLLTEFHKWASPNEARARGTREALHALDLEVDLLKERVAKLGRQKACAIASANFLIRREAGASAIENMVGVQGLEPRTPSL